MRYLVIWSFLLLFNNLYAQSVIKAYKYLDEKDYDKAVAILKKANEKKLEPLAVKFAYGKLYLSDDYGRKSNLRAYKSFRYVVRKLPKSKDKKHLQQTYGITQELAENQMNIAAQRAYSKIDDKQNEDDLRLFVKIYKDAETAQKVSQTLDSIRFSKISLSDFREYQNYANSYPNSKFAEEAEKRYTQIWKSIYDSVLLIGDYNNLRRFEKKYPDYPFYNDSTKQKRAIIREGAFINLSRLKNENYQSKLPAYIPKAAFSEIGYLALLWHIEPLLYQKKYKQALDSLKKYQIYFEDSQKLQQLAQILSAPKEQLVKSSISDKINTEAMEYAPCMTASEKQLYFCGRNRTDNLIQGGEDIFVSEKKGAEWGQPALVSDLNTAENHEAPLAVSADGNRMLIYSSSDIYYSDKTQNGWNPLRRFPEINESDSWEADAMLTADGNAIFFISDRADNLGPQVSFGDDYHGRSSGNLDIYVSVKQGDYWLPPVNLGKTVNTPFTERSPFLHPDMKTLYFSSDGHAGLGGLDVFMCKRLSDTSWTDWSEPVNLGTAVNTPSDEYDYKITASGTSAIFANKHKDNFDIMITNIPERFRPQTVTTISGLVTDNSGKKLQADIIWEDLETGETAGNLKSDPQSGNYIIVLPNGKNYGFYLRKTGYYPLSGNVDLRDVIENQDIVRSFVLISDAEIISGKTEIKLENVFFDTNKYQLKKESYPELNRLAEFLKSHPNLKIEISGHTDNQGNDAANMTLSQNRAESVRTYLIQQGCNSDMLTAKGYGESKPKTDNSTALKRAENRRVEFKVLK